MTKDDIINAVGLERYERECRLALTDAVRDDYGRGAGAELQLPHEIEDLIWYLDVGWRERIDLFFAIYADMPCYGHLMYAKHQYGQFPAADREYWWRRVQDLLGSDTRAHQQPLGYALWCDFFEDPATVKEAWDVLTAQDVPRSVVNQALRCSGPVPFNLKAPVYERLLPHSEWHDAIADSLFWSIVDVYGKVDRSAARRIVRRLKPSTARLSDLRTRLSQVVYTTGQLTEAVKLTGGQVRFTTAGNLYSSSSVKVLDGPAAYLLAL